MGHVLQLARARFSNFLLRNLAITGVQTLRNVEILRNSNGHISVLREATVTGGV